MQTSVVAYDSSQSQGNAEEAQQAVLRQREWRWVRSVAPVAAQGWQQWWAGVVGCQQTDHQTPARLEMDGERYGEGLHTRDSGYWYRLGHGGVPGTESRDLPALQPPSDPEGSCAGR